MSFRLIVILFLSLIAFVFILQNAAVVEIHFLFWSVQMSRSLWTFALVAGGVIIGWFLHGYVRHRSRKVI
ncbi:MAG TPA: LapA family protein [Gammaproteobacteria bacterium]|nr:LapA family protein [Gammaproteobacteria bacterium]